MFLLTSYPDHPRSGGRHSGPLLELEQRMTEFISQKSSRSQNEVLECVRTRRDEIRRERMGEVQLK